MKIENIDKNFAKADAVEEGLASYQMPCAPFDIYGVFYDEKEACFLRMNDKAAKSVGEGVDYLNHHTAGGRVKFSTDSDVFRLDVEYKEITIMSHMAITGSGGFFLLEETDETEEYVGFGAPLHIDKTGFSATIRLQGGKMRSYVLYMPLYNDVKRLTISLNEGASLGGGRKYRDIKPILYAGSSITQGGCASRPDTSYPALICKWNRIDFINMGFSGNFKGEKEMSSYLATLDCSLFVYDYDHNAPSWEHLEKTHYPMYEEFRAAHPHVPIIMISRPNGRTDDGEKRFKVIKNSYEKAKKAGDNDVYLIDGRKFFGKHSYQHCPVDGCHPTDHGFYLMAKTVYKAMIKADEIFK